MIRKKILGVLGGMGPAASARFYSLLTDFTKAECDQEHMDILIRSIASVPDRSAFIMKRSTDDPSEKIKSELIALAESGAGVIAVPCNTAEYFYGKLQNINSVPILSITQTAVSYAYKSGKQKLGLLATEGTVCACLYQKACETYGLEYELPSDRTQNLLTDIIYRHIKKSLPVRDSAIFEVVERFYENGCDSVILGCTELSFVSSILEKENYNFIDSLEALVAKSVEACGYELSSKAAKYINNKKQE